MSPEQVLTNRGAVDHRSDIYSLGATLYELLTLRPMHDAEGHTELIREIADEEPPSPRKIDPRIPRDLETIVLKATSKDAEDRYSSAKEMGKDLQRFLDDRPILARPPSLGTRLSKWTRRNRRLLTTAVTFAVAILGLVIGQLWYEAVQFQTLAAKEVSLRRIAESNLYRTEMLLAHEEWKEGNIANVLRLLDNHIPRPGEPDLRGWEWYYLKSLCHKDVATLEGHRKSVNWVAWSPDGKRLATASSDTTSRVWDVATRRVLFTLIADDHPVQWVAWSPDGSRVYSWSESEPVRIWDASTGKPLGFLGDRPVLGAVLSNDGTQILTADARAWVVIRDASSGEELKRWRGDLSWGPIAFSKDYVVNGERWPGRIKIFDVRTGKCLHNEPLLLHRMQVAAFSSDGLHVATASKGGTVVIRNPIDNSEVLSRRYHTGAVTQIAWRRGTTQLATVGDDGKVSLWDVSDGQGVNTLRGHAARIKSVAWSPDGSLLATGDAEGFVKLWNPEGPQEYVSLKGRWFGIWNPQGTLLATGGQELGSIDVRSPDKDGRIDIYDTTTWKSVVTVSAKFFGGTNSADWSPDGRHVAYSGRGGRVKAWEIPSKRELFSIAANNDKIGGLAWSPNARWLATGGADEFVKVWDVTAQKRIASMAGHTGKIGSVAWSPDGKSLASYSWNGEVKIWDTATWREVRELRPRTSESEANGDCVIAWSPSGDRLVAGSSQGWFYMWDVKSGREIMAVCAHVATIECLAWSPDGQRIATGGDDRTVKIWNANNGKRLLTLRGHSSPIRGLHWSPDGRQLASGARDGIRIWGPDKDEVQP